MLWSQNYHCVRPCIKRRQASVIERYLANYAEPEAQALASAYTLPENLNGNPLHDTRVWQGCLVIPAFDEIFEPLHRQLTSLASADVLIILVINAPEDANPRAIADTQMLLKQLYEQDYDHVIVVDRASDGLRLNPKHGVGLARKIGCDLALALRFAGRLRSDWVLKSDADVVFPAGYTDLLQACSSDDSAGARIFPHRHYSSDPTLHYAGQLYDQHMSYYVAGLAMAGSRYAHHSLGSTVAVHAKSYAAVRGYPKRSAGEDFYLLNKLRKLAPVQRLQGPTLSIEARISARVPFGTGPALRKIVESLAADPSGSSYLSYHPTCFRLLGSTLDALNQWAEEPHKAIHSDVSRRLSTLGFDGFAGGLSKQQTSRAHRHRSVHDWFDGLKTLQFIHGCQETYADQSLTRTLANLESAFRAKVFEFQTNSG